MNSLSKKMSKMSYVVAATGLVATAIAWRFVTTYMAVATVNYFMLLMGLTFLGKNKKIHAACMATAIASDLTLVAILEVKLNVIAESVTLQLSTLNRLHILCSLAVTILYIPVVFLGLRLLKSREANPKFKFTHGKLGWSVVVFRTLGFFLMFSMLGIHS